MPPSTEIRATIDDLYGVEGKAELIDGRIVPSMASGDHPSEIAFEIAVSLRDHVKRTGRGTARGDGLGYDGPGTLDEERQIVRAGRLVLRCAPGRQQDAIQRRAADLRCRGPERERSRSRRRDRDGREAARLFRDRNSGGLGRRPGRRVDPRRSPRRPDTANHLRPGRCPPMPSWSVPGWRTAVDEVFGPIDRA